MTDSLAADDLFFKHLRTIDFKIALSAKSKGCQVCKGPLDFSNFARKPRGAGESEEFRYSLCCRVDGCRKRQTTPSLRFFGRRVYPAWVFILAVDFYHRLGLCRKISRQTLSRWRTFWWRELMEESIFMRSVRGFLPPGFLKTPSPAGLLFHFGCLTSRDSRVQVLRFFLHFREGI